MISRMLEMGGEGLEHRVRVTRVRGREGGKGEAYHRVRVMMQQRRERRERARVSLRGARFVPPSRFWAPAEPQSLCPVSAVLAGNYNRRLARLLTRALCSDLSRDLALARDLGLAGALAAAAPALAPPRAVPVEHLSTCQTRVGVVSSSR